MEGRGGGGSKWTLPPGRRPSRGPRRCLLGIHAAFLGTQTGSQWHQTGLRVASDRILLLLRLVPTPPTASLEPPNSSFVARPPFGHSEDSPPSKVHFAASAGDTSRAPRAGAQENIFSAASNLSKLPSTPPTWNPDRTSLLPTSHGVRSGREPPNFPSVLCLLARGLSSAPNRHSARAMMLPEGAF